MNEGDAHQPPPPPGVTWPNMAEKLQFERAASAILNDRPHTISSGMFCGVFIQSLLDIRPNS